jgi:hypothetical protein
MGQRLVAFACACCVGCVPASTPPGDVGPGPGAGVQILRTDFERDQAGVYLPSLLEADWGVVDRATQGLKDGRASIVPTDRGRSLRVAYPASSVGPNQGGVQFFVQLPGHHDDLTCAYSVRFAQGFDFVKGGKLPGMVGGSHPTGGHPADDGFSARLMWRRDGAAVQYVYYPGQTSTFGEDIPYMESGSALIGSLSGTPARFRPGVWHRVAHRVVLNTPGKTDGVLQAWFDGTLVLDSRDRVWRLDDTVHIDRLYFSTFFGGNDPSWGPSRDETVDFDDFSVSELGQPQMPTVHGR